MEYLLTIALGVMICCIFVAAKASQQKSPSGTFVIDLTDPMKDVCRIELDTTLDAIYSKKQIVLNVKTYGEFTPN